MTRAAPLFGLAVCLVLMLPGCGRVLDWASRTWHLQDQTVKEIASLKDHIRSVAVYNEFSTRAIFDGLLLSDQVRTAYARVHACRRGRSPEQTRMFLRRQLEENKHFITFYVLSLHDIPLGEELSEWTVVLNVGGKMYEPTSIKAVDLPIEYKHFFGSHYTRFKGAYEITFDAHDAATDQSIATYGTRSVVLELRSMEKRVSLKWNLKKGVITLDG